MSEPTEPTESTEPPEHTGVVSGPVAIVIEACADALLTACGLVWTGVGEPVDVQEAQALAGIALDVVVQRMLREAEQRSRWSPADGPGDGLPV